MVYAMDQSLLNYFLGTLVIEGFLQGRQLFTFSQVIHSVERLKPVKVRIFALKTLN